MSDLQIFNHPELGEIRTLVYKGKPYFVGTDAAKILEYSEPHKAVSAHCKGGG